MPQSQLQAGMREFVDWRLCICCAGVQPSPAIFQGKGKRKAARTVLNTELPCWCSSGICEEGIRYLRRRYKECDMEIHSFQELRCRGSTWMNLALRLRSCGN